VGSHVLRALLVRGYAVRALVRTRSSLPEGCEQVVGDLRAPGRFARALTGCRYVIHCAALYSFAPRDRAAIAASNVAGTEGLLAAAHLAGVERAVLTSSSATVGAASTRRDADERDYPAYHAHRRGHLDYHASKVLQERAAFASRVPVVALLPTAPVGPGDWKPTPTGRMLLDFARGRMLARPPASGGMNLVPVEDVACAHVAALTRGNAGERYLLGAENLRFDELWDTLADLTGRPAPRARIPLPLLYAIGYADEVRSRLTGATPVVPLEGVRMASVRMHVDASKARRELGFTTGSVRNALARSLEWYLNNGYVDR
jgi:dihydroflavonol-4-reductase